MNFVLLGDNPAALPLLRAVCDSESDRLIGAALIGTLQTELILLAPEARVTSRWDEFLTDASVEAVIVAGNDPEVLDAARQFAAAGKPLLFLPQAAHGSAILYELSLIHDDTGVLLFPAFAARGDLADSRLKEQIVEGALGQVRYLEMSREQKVGTAGRTVLSSHDVDEALLRDVDLLRYLGGDYNQVTALYTGVSAEGIASATVTLAGNDLPQATWTMKGVSTPSRWQLKFVGNHGSANLVGNDTDCEVHVETNERGSGQTAFEQTQPCRLPTGTAILERFRAAVNSVSPSRDWTELIRAMETVEATHRSIRRRRTIDLHFESTSERSLFKTQMTAIGCGVISFTFFAVILLLLATTLFDVRGRQQIEAERAGGVIAVSEFARGTAEPLPEGREHLKELAKRMPAGRFTVLVEQSETEPELDDLRREAVVAALKEFGVSDPEQRTVSAPIEGRWFATALKIVRIAIFAPLFVYLLLQLLLFLTRPAAN